MKHKKFEKISEMIQRELVIIALVFNILVETGTQYRLIVLTQIFIKWSSNLQQQNHNTNFKTDYFLTNKILK